MIIRFSIIINYWAIKRFVETFIQLLWALYFRSYFSLSLITSARIQVNACECDNSTTQTISRAERLSNWLSRLTFRFIITDHLIILRSKLSGSNITIYYSPLRAFKRRRTRRPNLRNSIVFNPVVIILLFFSFFSARLENNW